MPVEFQSYDYAYKRKGKYIYVPSDRGERIGRDIKAQVESAYQFDDFIYHLRKKGGHVAALHAHRPHKFFSRVDIRRFFYSIARNRVVRALVSIGIDRSRHYAKWSCVKNPHGEDPSYVLPYGFIQSPILATLVLMESGVGAFLKALADERVVLPTVYMDDISLSSDDLPSLEDASGKLLECLAEGQFAINADKTCEPGPAMDLFNCDLAFGRTAVQAERVERFLSEPRTNTSLVAFENYCESVAQGNAAKLRAR